MDKLYAKAAIRDNWGPMVTSVYLLTLHPIEYHLENQYGEIYFLNPKNISGGERNESRKRKETKNISFQFCLSYNTPMIGFWINCV